MSARIPSPHETAADPPAFARAPIPVVVQQHADDAAHLRHLRSLLLRAPHVKLLHLARLDERIEAHLDGLAVAGPYGLARAEAALERLGCGEVFTAAVCALQERDEAALQRLLALVPVAPAARRGLLSALAWTTPALLRDRVRELLAAPQPWQRALGLEACRLHRVDPGAPLLSALHDADPAPRAAALRAAGELGRLDLLPPVLEALDSGDAALAPVAARAACLLGDRGAALRAVQLAAFAGPQPIDELRSLALALLDGDEARAALRTLEHDPASRRELIRCHGWLGDVRSVPWLLERLHDDEPQLARLLGEAFSLITGADLAALDLEHKPPEETMAGPNDDPADEEVALDADEDLPWPDVERVAHWWRSVGATSLPAAPRLFVGAPPDEPQGWRVLREGTQRQRALAAQWLVLRRPGRPLFPIAAPAWRQRRLLQQQPQEGA
ncbi:TIGR02270 family protein [Roseateles sp. DAIF2]|uniref:TIGR02270 family protein n=1 Tax=Roseateles sp. DAIF2 TaxID=2714952 RepID=UPI0018A32DF7|nr:TIGR02270 family protein [Roseateles sp. DAIF2]QPF75647.1 TIGR02270 family protein [Roseateles sp. DAIF2]